MQHLNILIVEDWKPIARALKTLLEAAGHKVTWIVGAQSHSATDGNSIIAGISAAGTIEAIDLTCSQFQLAFVDGQLEGNIQGPAMTKLLVEANVACCGMSTSTEINREMIDLGAANAAKKPVIFAAVLSELVRVNALLKPSRTVTLKLANLENHFIKNGCLELRQTAEAFIAPFIKEDM